MQERANAMGLPPNVSSAGLSELAKYDFSKAAPQLRMAGMYANPLLMPTNKTMTPGVAPTYTPTSAPTREEAFMQYAFPQGVQGVTNIEDNITRGLQFARNYNMNPTETLSFINRALPSGSYITPEGLKAAIEPRAGLLALAQPFIGPSVSFQRQFGTTTAGAPTGIDVVPKPVIKSNAGDKTIDITDSQLPVDGVRKGGPITLADGGDVVMGGEKAYTLADFGITTPQVAGTLGVPRDVMFNPELIAREKAKERTGLSDLIDLQNLAIRQGRTGKEYIDLFSDLADYYKYTPEQFARIEARGPATSGRIRPGYSYFAEGGVAKGLGSVAMKGYAEELRKQGRNGDTMLAHINPQEAKMLEMMGGSGTINPATGLPEYGFSWKKLLKAAQFIIPFIPGLGPIASAALSGIAGGFAGPGKGFDFKRGLLSGLASYGLGQIGKGLEAAGGPGVGAPIIDKSELMFGPPAPASSFSNPSIPTDFSNATAPINVASGPVMQGMSPGPSLGARVLDSGQNMYQGASNIISGTPGASEAFKTAAGFSPATAVTGTVAGLGVLGGYDETKKFQIQQAIANAKTEEERKMWEQIAAQSLYYLPRRAAAGGMMGLSALASGGATGPANAPRTINGAGDGMSDSVPATIEGIQEARLADGEFVIPADVVADLGNGSSSAGSKKLYAMMDRIRHARHGTTKQPPEINMNRLMPA